MKCPRDEAPLQLKGYWKHPRRKCPKCAGFLVGEAGVMEAMGHGGDKTFAAAADAKVAKLPESALSCPRDGQPMRVVVHQGVELEICPACRSIWLDHGEHEKIALLNKDKVKVDPGSIVDGIDPAEMVLEFLGDAVGSLFDGF